MEKRIELESGRSVAYDYLVIPTGPEPAFDEIPVLAPSGHTQSISRSTQAEETQSAREEPCRAHGSVITGAALWYKTAKGAPAPT